MLHLIRRAVGILEVVTIFVFLTLIAVLLLAPGVIAARPPVSTAEEVGLVTVPLPQTEFQPLTDLALSITGIGFIVALILFLIKRALPEDDKAWFFDEHPWLVNTFTILLSIGIAFLGAYLNSLPFDGRSCVEYVWRGLFSAAVGTLGYELTKNIGRSTVRVVAAARAK